MKKVFNFTKIIAIITLVLGFFFAPIFDSASAMSYNYDFWKNIIPSAEGIALQSTYYSRSFKYHKNAKYEEASAKLDELFATFGLDEVKELVSGKNYVYFNSNTTENLTKQGQIKNNYENAKLAIQASFKLTKEVKTQICDLIDVKLDCEQDKNLYKQVDFNSITDIQVYGDKVYVLSTPNAETISNIAGSSSVSEMTKLIVINSNLEWEEQRQEFAITDDVKNSFDNYYQWYRLSFDSVASGKNHTLAVDTSGNLWAWGSNEYGQLGLNPSETPYLSEPTQVSWIGDASGIKYTSVYATGNTSFAVDTNGNLWGFGKNDYNLISYKDDLEFSYVKLNSFSILTKAATKDEEAQYTNGTVAKVSLADDHIYVIDKSNKVYSWGDNSDGLLMKSTSNIQKYAVDAEIKLERIDTLNNDKVIELKPVTILTSKTHNVIVDDEGSLWVWGQNDKGQLGTGNTAPLSEPTLVTLRKNNVTVKVETISLGDEHTLLVDKLGGLWTFGSNSHFQLGFATDENGVLVTHLATPYAYHDDVDYTKVFAFGNSSYAMDINNNSYVFGQNDSYQLGFESEMQNLEYTKRTGISHQFVTGDKEGLFSIDTSNRLWVWGKSTTKLGLKNTEDVKEPVYSEHKLKLRNIALSRLENSDIYKRAVYVAYSKDENIAAIYLRSAAGIAVDEGFIYISDTQNSRILKVNKQTYVVEDVCLTPNNSTFKQLNLDSSVYQPSTLRQFKPTKVTVSPTGRVYAIAEQVYEGIIEFNKQGDYNRYLGQNDVVANPLKELLRDYLTEEQLAAFALTLPPLFTSISTDSKGFIYATSYPDVESGTIAGQNMVKAINTSGKDSMKRNGYVLPNGDAKYISSSPNANAILGPSYLVDVTINEAGNFTVIDEVRGRLFTYDSDGNLLYIAGAQPGGTKQNASGLSENIIKPVAIDYLYRTYTDEEGNKTQDEFIIVADQQSKSLMFYVTTEFGQLVNQATAAYNKGVDTAEKAQAVKAIWEEVRQRNTNYELAYLGIGKCILVESDYVETEQEQLKLYQEAMENFKLAHNGTYYAKAFGRYRDQILKKNFGWIMTAGVLLVVGIAGLSVYKTIKKNQAKKIKVQGGK